MIDEDAKIKGEAEIILEKIKGSSLYGKPIDMDNIDHLIVAAYYTGMRDSEEAT